MMYRNYRLRDYNFKLILFVVALTVIGIFAIGSAKESVQSKQIMGFALGFFLMLVISLFDYCTILNLYIPIYIVNLVLLILVDVMGKSSGGAQRWLLIAGVQFQPSELAKILLILFFAKVIMKWQDYVSDLRFLAIYVLLFAVPLYLVYKQPDLSTTIMLGVLFCIILFVGGISWKYVLFVLAITIPTVVILFSLILQPDQTLVESYQQARILAWLHPEDYSTTQAYQQLNAETAIGSGQLLGKGYKNNEVSSVKNGNFISEPQTDFIFAVIGEEFGFVGCSVVIGLLLFISFECIMVARRAKDIGGAVIATGVGGLIGFQGLMNIAVATGALPNTGIPLPFVSYGLTSLVSCYMGIGFVLNVRLQAKRSAAVSSRFPVETFEF